MTFSSQQRRRIDGYGLWGDSRVGIESSWACCVVSEVTKVKLLTLECRKSTSFTIMSFVVAFLTVPKTSCFMLSEEVVRHRQVPVIARSCRTAS